MVVSCRRGLEEDGANRRANPSLTQAEGKLRMDRAIRDLSLETQVGILPEVQTTLVEVHIRTGREGASLANLA